MFYILKNNVISIGLLSLILLLFSCKSEPKNNDNGIPLESLDKKLVYRTDIMAEDILTSLKDEKGVKYVLEYNYVAKLLNAGISQYIDMFDDSYLMLNLILGDLSSPKLIKVIPKPFQIKSMHYKLNSSRDEISSVTLILDINVDNNLANFRMMVNSKDGTLKNQYVLPEITTTIR